MGRPGKSWRSNAAKNGCADWAMPEHDNTPPFSNRRARACTAGVRETRANNSLVAVIEASCAKRGQSRSQRVRRQDGFLVFENVEGHIVGNGESVRWHGEQPGIPWFRAVAAFGGWATFTFPVGSATARSRIPRLTSRT